MDLNLSGMLRPARQPTEEPRVIEGRQYLSLTLPEPYQLSAQINLRNYKEEIEYICKRKNVPPQLQQFILRNFEKNMVKSGNRHTEATQSSPPRNNDQKKQMGNTSNTSITNLRTTAKQPAKPSEQPRTIYERDQERKKRQTLNLSSQMFKLATRELQQEKQVPHKKVQVRKANPKVFDKLHTEGSCSKRYCNQMINTIHKVIEQQSFEVRDRPLIEPKSQLMNLSNTERKPGEVHKRLYQQHVRRAYMAEKKKLQKQSALGKGVPTIDKSSKYLRNYRPFMSRLDEEIENMRKKKEFLSISTVDFTTNQQLFRPAINRSNPTKPRVYDFMNRSTELPSKEIQLEKQEKVEVMNRSTEIVRTRESKYVRSLADKLFATGRLVLDAGSIEKLGDKEFQIIYPFLSQMEGQKSINRGLFEEAFERFFSKLSVAQKHELKYAEEPHRLGRGNRQHSSKESSYPFKVRQFVTQPTLNSLSIGLAGENYYESILEFV